MEWVFTLYNVIIVAAIVHVLLDCRQPVKTVAWVMVIYFVPIVGIIAYAVFGINTRRQRIISRRQMDQLSRRQMDAFLDSLALADMSELPPEHESLMTFFARQDGALPLPANDSQLYSSGYEFFPALLSDIAKAEKHIHINIYIIEDDPLGQLLADALIAKSRQGVEVRMIYDDVGSWKTSHRYFERLREEGIEVCPFMPVRFPMFARRVNYRNHRKLIVIDGQVAFVGGMNIALRYVKGSSQPWRDTMVRISGPAALTVQRAFLIDWYFVDQTLINHKKYYPTPPESAPSSLTSPTSPLVQTVMHNPTSSMPVIQMGLLNIIMSAKHYVFIQTPYFLPTEPLLTALSYAAGAGVDVRLMVPLNSDMRFTDWASRSYLRQISQTGVQVELYRGGFLHSKTMVADDSVCTIGSTNIDYRSLENNFESNTFIYNSEIAVSLKRLFLADEGRTVPLSRVRRRAHPSIPALLAESLARLLSPLL